MRFALIALALWRMVFFAPLPQEVVKRSPLTTGGGGAAPTLVTTVAKLSFSSPDSVSIGTVNANDIVHYFVTQTSASQTFTMSLSGSCAAAGGNVTDAGPTNQGTAAATSQMGHLLVTTGGACSQSFSWTGAGVSASVVVAVIRNSSGLDLASTINNQNAVGSGTDAVTSPSITTTGANRLCIGSTVNAAVTSSTITAGTGYTIGSTDSGFPIGNESKTASSAGSVTATFTMTGGPYTQTGDSCYKP